MQVQAVQPWHTGSVCIGILTLMSAQVLVLVDKVPEGLLLHLCSYCTIVHKLYLILTCRYVNKIIGDTVTVHVIAVGVAVCTGCITSVEHSNLSTHELISGVTDTVCSHSRQLIRNDIGRWAQNQFVGAVHVHIVAPGRIKCRSLHILHGH